MAKKGRYVYSWPRPMVTVDAVVFGLKGSRREEGTSVLLVKRANEPFQGMWAVPGGFIEMNEELADAAARELAEETGIKSVKLEQMHTFGACGRDPRGRQITVVFIGTVDIAEQPSPRAGDDAAGAEWFNIEHLPEKMAFDHADVLRFAIEELKKKPV